MRPLAEVGRDGRSGGNEKISSRGVDVPGNACMMCGSVRHFGADQTGQALRPIPTIFDSVRR